MALKAHTHALAWRSAATLAMAALVAAVATGCGAGSAPGGKQSAGDFLQQVTTEFSRGQSGRLWDTLYPADQAVVSRARYTACQSKSGFELQKFKVLDQYSENVDISGKATPSTAVSVRATADDGVTTTTMHTVAVNGKWRWILSSADRATYKQGKCPSS